MHNYMLICMQARELLSSQDPMELLEASVLITSKLAEATSYHTTSLFPSDIQTTNVIVDLINDVLEEENEAIAGIGIDEVCIYIYTYLYILCIPVYTVYTCVYLYILCILCIPVYTCIYCVYIPVYTVYIYLYILCIYTCIYCVYCIIILCMIIRSMYYSFIEYYQRI